MTNFITDPELGQVIEKKQLFSFGAAPLTNFRELVFAAGGNKFSSLCGFRFVSKAQNQQYKNFYVAFVCKMRSKIYHNATNNPSQWYLFKRISDRELHCLTKEQLLMQYGFNVDKFFDSDYFQKGIATFKSLIKKGIDQYVPQYVAQHGDEADSSALTSMDSGTRVLVKDAAKRYVNAIKESLAYIDDKMCNNKFYKLINYDTYVEGEDEKVNEDEIVSEASKYECIVKDEGEGKFGVYEKDGNIWVATFSSEEAAKGFADGYPALKDKYLKSEKEAEDNAEMTEAESEEAAVKADEAELDKEIDEALKEIYK